jgi:hypothetical protein
MKYYASTCKFSNIENIYSFSTKAERDAYVEARDCATIPMTRAEVSKRLASNKKTAKEYHKSGDLYSCPTCFADIEEFHSFDR